MDKSGPIRLDDLLAFRGDIKQYWDARTTIIFVGPLKRQLGLFPVWLTSHDDSGALSAGNESMSRQIV